ncbi:MAG: 1-deoxy-D-xylulose-5-phosphate reductoisomerase [Verrucomicrobia bacterium]|jgi:1-deoxy-D-xylulose-5-phosphate reductoisomerase|nr:1-deoxy-D-xylulose-5-phosphate reductoisomerase [Verrucomicrobiota bacterium]
MSCRNIVVLGATGSIGQSASRVARELSGRVRIVGMSGFRNIDRLAAEANSLRPDALAVPDAAAEVELRAKLDYKPVAIFTGPGGLEQLATWEGADMVLVAIVGTGGLRPTFAALEAGKDIALASKEVLVVAGELVMSAARRSGRRIFPVDSEHNAIFQCLDGRDPVQVRRLILTASGGPFRDWPEDKMRAVTRQEALRHPTWRMGEKITIDSATMFNKGLEMIEARWLFDVDIARIDVVIHPQSIVHSMVEFVDGSVLAQMSHSDMRFPIQYALTWPDRIAGSLPPLDWARLARLDFEEPRYDVFPALELARQAARRGGAAPAVLNAANEVAVAEFLAGRIAFPRIWQIVAAVLGKCGHRPGGDLETLLASDLEARGLALAEARS